MLFVPASMPAVEAQQEEEPTTTLQYLTWEQAGWNGPFSIEFPDDCPGQAGLDFTNLLSCWTILPSGLEFPMQQTKRYGDTYPIQRTVGFYDAPLWKTSVQVFEHISNSPGWKFFKWMKDESATDSEVLTNLALYHQLECEREYFDADKTRLTEETVKYAIEEGLTHSLPQESARDCVWIKAVDSYIFYTNDNKKMYIVKSVYLIDWWYLPGFLNPGLQCLPDCPNLVIFISGMIYEENSIWEIMAESVAMNQTVVAAEWQTWVDNPTHEHDGAIIHMLKSFSLEPKSEQSATEPVTAIPEWIKNNAGWWADGQIDDSSFLQGIQFLIKEGIMVIPPTATSESSGSEGVPAWVKNNAGWWAEGQIDDSSFLQGIQYLVKEGIIKVS